MVAACAFAIMALLIKLLGQRLHVTQVLLVRQIVMGLVVAPTILNHFPGALRTNRLGLQMLRVALASFAMLTGFTAVIHLPLADVTAIGFAKSFFVTIFAIIVLKETIGIRRWGATIVGFIGVLIMLRPGTESFSAYGLYALASAAAVGVVMVVIRLLTRTESPLSILSYQALGVGVVMTVPGIWFWQWPTVTEWLMLGCMGLVSFLAQMANIYAYKWGEASVMATLDYMRLLFATLLGYLVFSNLPGFWTWVGAGIVVAAAIYTIQREARNRQELTQSPVGRGNIA